MSYYNVGMCVGAEQFGPSEEAKKKGGLLSVAIVLGLTAAIFGLSPGARHFYRHGKLPG